MSGDSQLQDKVVYEFLNLFFCISSFRQISLRIDVQEGGNSADGHGGSIFLFDACQICKVGPLNRLSDVSCRLGNVVSISLGHFLYFFQRHYLIGDLFRKPDVFFTHNRPGRDSVVVLLLLFD